MTELEFFRWLQGFFEIADPSSLDATQTQIIKDHLALVGTKVTPDRRETYVIPQPEPFRWPQRSPTWPNITERDHRDKLRIIC